MQESKLLEGPPIIGRGLLERVNSSIRVDIATAWAVTWLPLLILSTLGGYSEGSVPLPFLGDFAVRSGE